MAPKLDLRRALAPEPGRNAPPADTPQDIAEKHEMRVYLSYLRAWPVRMNGFNYFIAAINTLLSGGGHETTIYLRGSSVPRTLDDIEVLGAPP